MFFKVWKRCGLKRLPKIVLTETKQIIPDKNLFGQSNFASNAANVVIQLMKDPVQVSRQSISRVSQHFQGTDDIHAYNNATGANDDTMTNDAPVIGNVTSASNIDGEDESHSESVHAISSNRTTYDNENIHVLSKESGSEHAITHMDDELEMQNIYHSNRKKTNDMLEGQK